jgi:hypothetical protein
MLAGDRVCAAPGPLRISAGIEAAKVMMKHMPSMNASFLGAGEGTATLLWWWRRRTGEARCSIAAEP